MKSQSFFSSITGIISIIILTLGIVAGVTLVKTEHDIRNKAKELKEHKVAICHKTGSESNPWVQIEVSENAVPAHLTHGDIQGNCPETKKDDDDDNNNNSGTGGSSLSTTNVTVVNETISCNQPTPEIKYIYITTRFDFRIKFQGINKKTKEKITRVLFRKSEEELHVYNKVEVSPDSNGIFRGTITDIRPGTYDVLIKSDGFLQKLHEKINISRGLNSFDWSEEELLAGDFNSDNILKAKDVAEFLSYFVYEINPVTDETKVFDINMDGFLSLEDLNLVLVNFDGLERFGDN